MTSAHVSSELNAALIPGLPPSFYYIPDIVSSEQAARLIESQKWVELSRRRLQVYPSQLTANNVLLASGDVPQWLDAPLGQRFEELGVFAGSTHGKANHILVNNYKPGEGIMPHEDGAAYDPITATVSLGGHTVLDIYKKRSDGEREDRPTWRLLQEARSLLVTRDESYKVFMHGIAETQRDEGLVPDTIANWAQLGNHTPFASGSCDRPERISLTCRDVRKVSKLGSKLLLGRK